MNPLSVSFLMSMYFIGRKIQFDSFTNLSVLI